MKSLLKATIKQTNQSVHIVLPSENVDKFIEFVNNPDNKYIVFEVGEMPLAELPENIQEKVKEQLTCFDETKVTFDNDKFWVSPHTFITANYSHDHFVCGTYRADEVYTEEERKQHLKELNSYEFPEWAW